MIAKHLVRSWVEERRDTLVSPEEEIEERSGVFPSSRGGLRCGLLVSASSPCSSDEPHAVYGTPCWIEGTKRTAFGGSYYLGTRFETGVIASAVWQQEMDQDGVPEHVIEQAREYLAAHGM